MNHAEMLNMEDALGAICDSCLSHSFPLSVVSSAMHCLLFVLYNMVVLEMHSFLHVAMHRSLS